MIKSSQNSLSAVEGQRIPIFLSYEGQKTNYYEVMLQIFATIDVLHKYGISVSKVHISGLSDDLKKRVFEKLATMSNHKIFKKEMVRILNKNSQLKPIYEAFKTKSESLVQEKLTKSQKEQELNNLISGIVKATQVPLTPSLSPTSNSISKTNSEIDNEESLAELQESENFLEDFLEILIDKYGPETDDAFMSLVELGFVEFEEQLQTVGLNLKTVFKASEYEYSQREFANREYINWLIYLFYGSRENMPRVMDNMIEIRNRLFMAMIK